MDLTQAVLMSLPRPVETDTLSCCMEDYYNSLLIPYATDTAGKRTPMRGNRFIV
jgi:hypothetical protein